MNILVAGFQHETNTFAPTMATYDSFVRGEDFPAMVRGQSVRELLQVNIPISGFIRHVEALGHTVTPVIWAGAGASAHVTTQAYEQIAGEIVEAVKTAAFDAIYLDLHGAMVAEHIDDGEGELLKRVRALVGQDMKIAVSVDSHANMTAEMFALANVIAAYRTYPHVDMADTGRRAAEMLLHVVGTKAVVHFAVARLPFLIPVNAMSTMMHPARGMYDALEALEKDVVSLSFAPGFPASDFSQCGPTVWGYGHDLAKLEHAVEALYSKILAAESEWSVEFEEPSAAVRRAIQISAKSHRPVIIADTQDNPGVGGDSNTTGILRALLAEGAENSAIGLIVDPAAAAAAHKAGVGARIEIALGGCPKVSGDEPLRATFEVEALSDGKFVYGGPMMNGKAADLGPMASLRIEGVRVAVSSAKAQLLDRNMYRAVGIKPEEMRILVNKSSVHFRADFGAIAEEIIVARAPGPFTADPSQLPWRNLKVGMRTGPNGPAFTVPAPSDSRPKAATQPNVVRSAAE